MLKICLLGSFRIFLDDALLPENIWHTKQARQLLKILLTYRGKIVPRDVLIDALWPDADPAKAATTLRTAINALRKTLEPNRPRYTPSSFIVAHAPGYKFQFTQLIWVDTLAFDAILDNVSKIENPAEKQTTLESALNLYQDDYLSDDLYVDWSIAERDRLRERYLNALIALADNQAEQGRIDRAIASLRRVIVRDPGQEPVYRTLMRYYLQQGDMVSALKAFEQLRQYLSTELGADPSSQTLILHQAILNGQWSETPTLNLPETSETKQEKIFIGRETELATLKLRLANLAYRQGRMIALFGESGIGKSQLAEMALNHASKKHIIVLSARCQSIEQELPFAPIVEALTHYAIQQQPNFFNNLSTNDKAYLAHLFPALAWQVEQKLTSYPTEVNRQWVVGVLVKILLNLAKQPLVLFLDDVQWIDQATLTLLANLNRYIPQTPILVLLAYRAEDLDENASLTPFLRDMTRLPHVDTLELKRFSDVESELLLQKTMPNLPRQSESIKSFSRALYQLTGGNPLFIVETVRAFLDEHPNLPITDLAKIQPSRPVTDAILSRVTKLSPDARAVLEMGAVIGRDFSTDLLEALAPTDPLPALSTVLRRQFLIEISPGRLDFSHQLVREVIYRQLSPLARRRLHGRVAQGLISLFGRQAGARASEIADHSSQAGAVAREQSLIFSVLAGDYALHVYGFEQAANRYRHALTLTTEIPDVESVADWVQRAYRGLGLAQESLQVWDDARDTYRAYRRWAQNRGDDNSALMAKYRLASMLGMIGQLAESASLTAKISRALPSSTPQVVVDGQKRLRLLSLTKETPPTWTESGFPVFQPQLIKSKSPWIDMANFLGKEQAAQTLNLYGWALTLQGQSNAAESSLKYAAQLADTLNQPGLRATSFHLLAQLWDMRGDYEQMVQSLGQALALVEGMPHLQWIVIWGRIHRAYVDIRWNQVQRAATRFHQLDTELKNQAVLRSHWLSVQVGLGLLAMFRNKPDEAARYFETARENMQNLYASNYVALYVSLARLHRHRQEFEAAERAVVQAMAFAAERGMLADYISALAEASRFAQATAQPGDVLHLLQRSETMATRAELIPARLSTRLALYRTFEQLNMPQDSAWYKRLARTDRDSIAATIVNADDRAAYLSRRDLKQL